METVDWRTRVPTYFQNVSGVLRTGGGTPVIISPTYSGLPSIEIG